VLTTVVEAESIGFKWLVWWEGVRGCGGLAWSNSREKSMEDAGRDPSPQALYTINPKKFSLFAKKVKEARRNQKRLLILLSYGYTILKMEEGSLEWTLFSVESNAHLESFS